MASDYRQHEPSRGFRVARSDHANGNRVSPAQLDLLCERVRHWRARGWTVLAFRPPTPPAVTQLTDELSGFDESQVARLLTDAGAHWVPLHPADFESYDGSHLTAMSARQLSKQLAQRLYKLSSPSH